MKLRLSDRFSPQDGGVFVPVDPLPPSNPITELFVIRRFEALSNPGHPMQQNAVNWSIAVKDAGTPIEEYQFRLVVFGHVMLNSVQPQGSAPFQQTRDTLASLWVRHGQGSWVSFDQKLRIPLDRSQCSEITVLGLLFQGVVLEQVRRRIEEEDVLRYRKITRPVDPSQPNGPREVIQLEPEVDWNIHRIRFTLPLEIVLPNFFNGALDIIMEVRFNVYVEGDESVVDVQVSFKSDANFSFVEDILSLGHTATIAATLDRIVPELLKCQTPRIEAEILRQLINREVRDAVNALPGGDVFQVNIVDGGGDDWQNFIKIIVCPRQVAGGGTAPTGPVVVGGGVSG